MPIVRDLIFELNKQIQNKMPIQFLVNKFDVEGVSPDLTVQNIEKVLEWSKKLDNLISFHEI